MLTTLALFAEAPKSSDSSSKAAGLGGTEMILLIVAGIAVLIFLVFLFIFFSFIRLWIQALLTKAEIGIGSLIGMKLRNVDYGMIVRQKIALVQAGVKVTTGDLESHFLARGNVPKTATAVIAAHKAGLDLPWRTAAAIDLAGRDVLEAVRTSVNPKVIDCPDPAKGKQFLDARKVRNIRFRRHFRFKLLPYANAERVPVFLFQVVDQRRNAAMDMAVRVDPAERRFPGAQGLPRHRRAHQGQ